MVHQSLVGVGGRGPSLLPRRPARLETGAGEEGGAGLQGSRVELRRGTGVGTGPRRSGATLSMGEDECGRGLGGPGACSGPAERGGRGGVEVGAARPTEGGGQGGLGEGRGGQGGVHQQGQLGDGGLNSSCLDNKTDTAGVIMVL